MDLDGIGTGDVVFMLHADTENTHSVRSEAVSFSCRSIPLSHAFPGWRSADVPR